MKTHGMCKAFYLDNCFSELHEPYGGQWVLDTNYVF